MTKLDTFFYVLTYITYYMTHMTIKSWKWSLPTMPKMETRVTAMPSIQKLKALETVFFSSDKLLWLEAVLEDIWLKWRDISTCRDPPHMPCLSLPCQLHCCCWCWMPPCQWRWWCEHRVIMLTSTLVAFKMIPSFSSSTVSATKPTTPITSCANHWISQSPCWSSGVQRL